MALRLPFLLSPSLIDLSKAARTLTQRRSVTHGTAERPCRRTVPQSFETLEGYPDTEIDIDFPNCIAEILKGEVGIAAGVDEDDKPASPSHHFVETEVLEVTAIGQIDVGTGIVGLAKRFREKRSWLPQRTILFVRSLADFTGMPSHQPSRTLNNVNNSAIEGDE